MEKVKLWFMLHDGEYGVCISNNAGGSKFSGIKILRRTSRDKGYVFMLGTPNAAKIANDSELDEDPTIAKSFSTITIQNIAILFDPKEDLISGKRLIGNIQKMN